MSHEEVLSLQKRVSSLSAENAGLRERLEQLSAWRQSFQAKLQALQTSVVEQVSAVVSEVEVACKTAADSRTTTSRREGRGPYKLFFPRESALTVRLQEPDYQTIFNIAVAFCIMLNMNLVIRDLFSGKLLDLTLLLNSFSPFASVWGTWLALFVMAFAAVPTGHIIASASSRTGRGLAVLAYLAAQAAMFALAPYAIMSNQISLASSVLIMCEQTRLSMKMHSYVRERYRYRFQVPPKSQDVTVEEAAIMAAAAHYRDPTWHRELQRYFFFLWVPTLIYRPQYPRTKAIRWRFVMGRIMEFTGVVYYLYMIARLFLPQFHAIAHRLIPLPDLVMSVFSCMLPATAILLLCFFGLLHSWLNMFAELTMFADRQFYEDWWNVTGWASFYRKWNGVVHDWIHAYIYTDARLLGANRGLATLLAFMISAWIHEIIVAVAMRFFYPVLLIFFGGPGVLFTYLTRLYRGARGWNTFMWLMLAMGNGLLMVMYTLEWAMQHEQGVLSYQASTAQGWHQYLPLSWRVYLM